MTVRYLVGDVRDRMADIPDGSISLVATSPPFVALRSYLPADHPLKDREIGSEPDPATFLDTLLGLTAEWGRALAPWGSIAVELGDTYAGSGGAGGDYNDGGLRDGQNTFGGSARKFRKADGDEGGPRYSTGGGPLNRGGGLVPLNAGAGWPRAKCLALVPQLYAASLAYGRNLLTGQPSPAGQWLVRNVIVWHRPNPAVGALGDKVRPSTSYITVATRSPKRWFDLTAVRTPADEANKRPSALNRLGIPGRSDQVMNPVGPDGQRIIANAAGAPPLDCWFDEHDTWTITTQPSRLAHYAMWPPKLAERLILMMCPAEVCATCGEPRRKIEGRSERYAKARAAIGDFNQRDRESGSVSGSRSVLSKAAGGDITCAENVTLGWTSCPCADYRPGHVLDPFAGTATTLCVAHLHGRDATGIDLDERNRDLLDARMAECRRALFDVAPEIPGQLAMTLEAHA